MSESAYRPVPPVPRPRRIKSEDEPDCVPQSYENVVLPSVPDKVSFNHLNEEVQRPVPAPRRAKSSNERSEYENAKPELLVIKNDTTTPSRSMGAIKKTTGNSKIIFNEAPNSPKASRKYEITPDKNVKDKDYDGASINSSTSSNSKDSAKFTTLSPSQIFKSFGTTSKMLSDSIGERITEKTSSAKHKIVKDYRSSKHMIENWTEEKKSNTTKKLKNVREKLSNATFSLKRKDKNERRASLDMVSKDRPQTMPPNNDELFQSLSFHSPLNSRTNNSENIPGESAMYEIPKSFRLSERSSESNDLPSYDDVVKDDHSLQRNTMLTQSMYTMVQKNGLKKSLKNKSDTHLNEISDEPENYEDVFPRPRSPPRIPPPPLPKEGIYGKIKSVPSLNYENAPPIVKRRPPGVNIIEEIQLRDDESTRVNISSSQIFPRNLSGNYSTSGANIMSKKASSTANVSQCESWGNYDGMSMDSVVSSVEPIYSNDENERVDNESTDERLYGRMFEMNTDMLCPQKILNTDTANALRRSLAAVSLTRELLTEFDPLSNEKKLEEFMTNNTNHLALLETLLGEETYGSVGDQNLIEDETLFEEDSSVESVTLHPSPPERLDSLDEVVTAPVVAPISAPKIPPRSSKKPPERQSQIIHQNLHLRAESYENLDDVSEPFLAKVTEQSKPTNVDLTRPKPTQTNWFVDNEPEKFVKNNLDNPLNNKSQQKSHDKVMKTVPILPPKQNNLDNYLPTYEESKNDEIVAGTSGNNIMKPEKTKTSIFQSMLNLKRKPSLNRQSKPEVAAVVQRDYITRPPFSEDFNLLLDKTVILFKLPSGVLEDILKELNPRFIELKRKQFKAYSDSDFKILKEHIDLTHMSSCQYVVNHKFTDGGRQIYCFEMNLAIPKHSSSNSQSNSSSPSTSNTSGKMTSYKTNRVTHVYGIHTKMEKSLWMQKVIRSLTNVFPKEYSADYTRAGWCYVKKSITTEWKGTWVLISRRKLMFYDYNESRLEVLDLRKARCVGLKESDDSIHNLQIEKGPTMLIDCPPFTCYFIMATPRETKIWSTVIKDEAHANGTMLRHQQLTKDNVPVFVDKTINFIYTNGSMSEGIYRKPGSTSNVQKLVSSLRKDAFSVQITRTEYNEHDVSSCLKKFMRELPEPLLGKLGVSFISVSEMGSKIEKIQAYRELLLRLPSVEYQTLRKILGHLNFIQSQRGINRMGSENLAMVWGPTLMQPQNSDSEMEFSRKESQVVSELILLYKNLYELQPDEIKKEQIMLTVLQKYHSAAENLSDSVKHSGDLKIWVTLDPNPELNSKADDKKQINVALTPMKTVYELCKELSSQMKLEGHQLTLMEVILNGELQRPLHYNEKVLNIVLRWANWPENDRKTNFLELRPQTKFQLQVERAMKTLPSLIPNGELKFADRKTKSMKSYILELNDTNIIISKQEKTTHVKIKDVDTSSTVVYIGAEKKRDCQMRWALTLVELNFAKRSRDSPYIGHIIAGNNTNDQIVWYTSILYSIHGSDISPNPEIVIT